MSSPHITTTSTTATLVTGATNSNMKKSESAHSLVTWATQYSKSTTASQSSELDPVEWVLMHEPSTEVVFGALHPEANLYERGLNKDAATADHQSLQKSIHELSGKHAKVLLVRHVLEDAMNDPVKKKWVMDFVGRCLVYEYGGDISHITGGLIRQLMDAAAADKKGGLEKQKWVLELLTESRLILSSDHVDDNKNVEQQLERLIQLSPGYKQTVIENMSVNQIINTILIRPVVELEPSSHNTPLQMHETRVRPLTNLVYTRDQQIVTAKGVIIANLNSSQRKDETDLMELVFRILDIQPLFRVQDPGKLEGGDFFPINEHLCLLGVGLRTNVQAAKQLLEKDLFGTDTVALVYDEMDRNQQRMHLDTIMNIVDEKHVMILEDVIKPDSKIKRVVREYKRRKRSSFSNAQHERTYRLMQLVDDLKTVAMAVNAGGTVPDTVAPISILSPSDVYERVGQDMELGQWLISRGYTLIPVTDAQQKDYMINFLHIGSRRILSVHRDLEKVIRKFPNVNVDEIRYCEIDGIKRMFGAAHCATTVFRQRTPTMSKK